MSLWNTKCLIKKLSFKQNTDELKDLNKKGKNKNFEGSVNGPI